MKKHFVDIVNYNLWANLRMVDLLQRHDEALLHQPIVNSFPSIMQTFFHIWGAEKIWLKRLQGKSLSGFPIFEGTLQEQFDMGMQISNDFFQFIKSQSDDFFEGNCAFKDTQGQAFEMPVIAVIQHCMNHSTYHRGQIVTLGKQAGFQQIASTDYVTFVRLNTT